MNTNNELIGRIAVDPEVMVGKPVVKGTRLTVEHILSLLISGMTIEEILEDYPNLAREDIFACLAFAKEALSNSTFMPLSY